MARDRQRGKQRRRGQDGDGSSRARPDERLDELAEDSALEGTTPGSHPDSGLEDVVDRVGPEGTTPTPDPLKHASPYVDEAKLTEAGADAPGNDGEPLEVRDSASGQEDWGFDDVDADGDEGERDRARRAPDAVEGDTPMRTRRGAAVATAGGEAVERRDGRERGRALTFLRNCVEELKRVHWPNRKQTFQGTAVTLGFVVLAGGFLGLMDQVWRPIVEAIL